MIYVMEVCVAWDDSENCTFRVIPTCGGKRKMLVDYMFTMLAEKGFFGAFKYKGCTTSSSWRPSDYYKSSMTTKFFVFDLPVFLLMLDGVCKCKLIATAHLCDFMWSREDHFLGELCTMIDVEERILAVIDKVSPPALSDTCPPDLASLTEMHKITNAIQQDHEVPSTFVELLAHIRALKVKYPEGDSDWEDDNVLDEEAEVKEVKEFGWLANECQCGGGGRGGGCGGGGGGDSGCGGDEC